MAITTIPEARILETADARISYRDIGSGPAILLLHGGGPGATGMSNFSGNIAALQNDYRLIIPDQPGYGDSRLTNDNGWPFPDLSAKAMADLLDALGIEKAHVFGNSLGGGVAIQLADARPELVDRLILMGPYVWGFAPRLLTARPLGEVLLEEYYPNPTPERLEALIRAFVYDADAIEGLDAIVKERFELTLNPELEAGYARVSIATNFPDHRSPAEVVSGIKHRTLILWGRDDRFSHLEDAFSFLTAMKNSELVVLRDTGHWVMIERAEEFASYVKAFLARA